MFAQNGAGGHSLGNTTVAPPYSFTNHQPRTNSSIPTTPPSHSSLSAAITADAPTVVVVVSPSRSSSLTPNPTTHSHSSVAHEHERKRGQKATTECRTFSHSSRLNANTERPSSASSVNELERYRLVSANNNTQTTRSVSHMGDSAGARYKKHHTAVSLSSSSGGGGLDPPVFSGQQLFPQQQRIVFMRGGGESATTGVLSGCFSDNNDVSCSTPSQSVTRGGGVPTICPVVGLHEPISSPMSSSIPNTSISAQTPTAAAFSTHLPRPSSTHHRFHPPKVINATTTPTLSSSSAMQNDNSGHLLRFQRSPPEAGRSYYSNVTTTEDEDDGRAGVLMGTAVHNSDNHDDLRFVGEVIPVLPFPPNSLAGPGIAISLQQQRLQNINDVVTQERKQQQAPFHPPGSSRSSSSSFNRTNSNVGSSGGVVAATALAINTPSKHSANHISAPTFVHANGTTFVPAAWRVGAISDETTTTDSNTNTTTTVDSNQHHRHRNSGGGDDVCRLLSHQNRHHHNQRPSTTTTSCEGDNREDVIMGVAVTSSTGTDGKYKEIHNLFGAAQIIDNIVGKLPDRQRAPLQHQTLGCSLPLPNHPYQSSSTDINHLTLTTTTAAAVSCGQFPTMEPPSLAAIPSPTMQGLNTPLGGSSAHPAASVTTTAAAALLHASLFSKQGGFNNSSPIPNEFTKASYVGGRDGGTMASVASSSSVRRSHSYSGGGFQTKKDNTRRRTMKRSFSSSSRDDVVMDNVGILVHHLQQPLGEKKSSLQTKEDDNNRTPSSSMLAVFPLLGGVMGPGSADIEIIGYKRLSYSPPPPPQLLLGQHENPISTVKNTATVPTTTTPQNELVHAKKEEEGRRENGSNSSPAAATAAAESQRRKIERKQHQDAISREKKEMLLSWQWEAEQGKKFGKIADWIDEFCQASLKEEADILEEGKNEEEGGRQMRELTPGDHDVVDDDFENEGANDGVVDDERGGEYDDSGCDVNMISPAPHRFPNMYRPQPIPTSNRQHPHISSSSLLNHYSQEGINGESRGGGGSTMATINHHHRPMHSGDESPWVTSPNAPFPPRSSFGNTPTTNNGVNESSDPHILLLAPNTTTAANRITTTTSTTPPGTPPCTNLRSGEIFDFSLTARSIQGGGLFGSMAHLAGVSTLCSYSMNPDQSGTGGGGCSVLPIHSRSVQAYTRMNVGTNPPCNKDEEEDDGEERRRRRARRRRRGEGDDDGAVHADGLPSFLESPTLMSVASAVVNRKAPTREDNSSSFPNKMNSNTYSSNSQLFQSEARDDEDTSLVRDESRRLSSYQSQSLPVVLNLSTTAGPRKSIIAPKFNSNNKFKTGSDECTAARSSPLPPPTTTPPMSSRLRRTVSGVSCTNNNNVFRQSPPHQSASPPFSLPLARRTLSPPANVTHPDNTSVSVSSPYTLRGGGGPRTNNTNNNSTSVISNSSSQSGSLKYHRLMSALVAGGGSLSGNCGGASPSSPGQRSGRPSFQQDDETPE